MGRLIASDLRNTAELGRDRANLNLHLAVDDPVLLAAIERRAGQTDRDILDTAEEGPDFVDRMSDHEALPELNLRLPIDLDPCGSACCDGSWGGANACGSKGRGRVQAHFAGAARSGRPQPLAAASGNRFEPTRPPVGKDALHRAHDTDITRASAQIPAHRDADVRLSLRL